MTLIRHGSYIGLNTDSIATWWYNPSSGVITLTFASGDEVRYEGVLAQALLAYLTSQAADITQLSVTEDKRG